MAEHSTEALESLDARIKATQTPEGIIEIKLQPFIRGFTKAVKEQTELNGERAEQLWQIISTLAQVIFAAGSRFAARCFDFQFVR